MPVDALLGIRTCLNYLTKASNEVNLTSYKPGILIGEEFTDILPSTRSVKDILTEKGFHTKQAKLNH
jgi:hypothetical protein